MKTASQVNSDNVADDYEFDLRMTRDSMATFDPHVFVHENFQQCFDSAYGDLFDDDDLR